MMVLRCKSPEWIAYTCNSFNIYVLVYISQIINDLHVHELFDFDILKKTYLILESILFPIYADEGRFFI